MPYYLFQCVKCDTPKRQFLPMERASETVVCDRCEQVTARRVFTAPRLITQPEHLKDENKFALGFSERDRTDKLKDGDKWQSVKDARASERIKENRRNGDIHV